MKIELIEEQKLLRDTVRRFAEEVVKPRAKEIDETGEFPRSFFDQAGELGLAGVAVPEEYGGAGMDTLSYCLVIEEISRVCATSGVILSVNNSLVCDPLLKFGTEEQKQEFLTPLAAGEKLGCFALTEPGAGSDAAGLRTHRPPRRRRLRPERQQGVHHQRHRRRRRPGLRHRRPGEEAQGHHRLHRAADTPGYSHGTHEFKLGVNASGTTELAFEDMRVPAALPPGRGGRGLQDRHGHARRRPHRHRRPGGRHRPGGVRGGARLRPAARAVRPDDRPTSRPSSSTSPTWRPRSTPRRLLTWKAAWAKENQKRYTLEAAQAKLFASEMAQRVTNKALQIHGGYGYTKEYNVERYFRDARITEIYEGTSEIQKMVIADWVLNKA